jgi:hypothetical protein
LTGNKKHTRKGHVPLNRFAVLIFAMKKLKSILVVDDKCWFETSLFNLVSLVKSIFVGGN